MITMDQIADEFPDVILLTGLDDAIIGVGERHDNEPFIIYDVDKIIEINIKSGCADREEAIEFYEFNQIGLYAGVNSPCFCNVVSQ